MQVPASDRALAMLCEMRAWTNDEEMRVMEPCLDFIINYRYYYGGVGLATSDFEACFTMQKNNCGRLSMITGTSNIVMMTGFSRAGQAVARAADCAYQSSDILKRVMESRSQPQRDALVALRFAQLHGESEADVLFALCTNIAIAAWAVTIVDNILLAAHLEEGDTSFASYLYTAIHASYYNKCIIFHTLMALIELDGKTTYTTQKIAGRSHVVVCIVAESAISKNMPNIAAWVDTCRETAARNAQLCQRYE